MKTFARQINRQELTELCVCKGWPLDTRKYDQEGSDWVTFRWKHQGRVRPVIYSSWNGHFIVIDGDNHHTERSADDCAPWFKDLLDLLYVGQPVTKENAA